MALGDKLVMSDETAKGLVNGIKVGGFWGRVVGYFLFGVPMFAVLFLVMVCGGGEFIVHKFGLPNNADFIMSLMFILTVLLFILIEWRVRSWRRK
ncbi:MAG: hypothetical protein PHE60_00775, partial [Sulfurospirillaceae bacterium]|nr:hypothetical protein [Sulfurospirillaceae bacterium]